MKGVIIVYNVYDFEDIPPIKSGDDVFLVVCKGLETISGDFETQEIHIFKTSASYATELVRREVAEFEFDSASYTRYSANGKEDVDASEIMLRIAEREERRYDDVKKRVKVIKHY